jgi:hypothetical protein
LFLDFRQAFFTVLEGVSRCEVSRVRSSHSLSLFMLVKEVAAAKGFIAEFQ